jgi:hypothetical protein
MSQPVVIDAIVPAGDFGSFKINIEGLKINRLLFDGNWVASSIHFVAFYPGTNDFFVCNSASAVVLITTSGFLSIPIDSSILSGVTELFIRKGAPGVPVNQVASSTIKIVAERIV